MIFTSRIFSLALEITFLLNTYFFLQMDYELLSQSRKLYKRGVLIRARGVGVVRKFFEKISGGTLIRGPRVFALLLLLYLICELETMYRLIRLGTHRLIDSQIAAYILVELQLRTRKLLGLQFTDLPITDL